MNRLLSSWLCVTALFLAALPTAASTASGPLDLNGRIACRKTIEQVYWKHRTWPSANPGQQYT